MKKMVCPFDNDMIGMVWEAFHNLYPDKTCTCYWDPTVQDSEETGPYGATDFMDDGEIIVRVSPTLALCDSAEVFAHELAHVAAGLDNAHNDAWDEAFDRIFNEYNRIAGEKFPDAEMFEGSKGVAE